MEILSAIKVIKSLSSKNPECVIIVLSRIIPIFIKSKNKDLCSGGRKVQPVFKDSTQLEYKEGDWFYRARIWKRAGR